MCEININTDYHLSRYVYFKDACRAVEQWHGVKTSDGIQLTVNLRPASNKTGVFYREADDSFAHRYASMSFGNPAQLHYRLQQDTGRDDGTSRTEQISSSVTMPHSPDRMDKTFTTTHNQHNSHHTSPRKNKKGKNKKKGSQSTTQTTPSRTNSLANTEGSLFQPGRDRLSEQLSKLDYKQSGQARSLTTHHNQSETMPKAGHVQAEEQARKDHDIRKPKPQFQSGFSKNGFGNNHYSSQLASDGSPKKKTRKPNPKSALDLHQTSPISAMKDSDTELLQIASGRTPSKEIFPLNREEWPSLSEFSTRATSPEHYPPLTGSGLEFTPERSMMNRSTAKRTGTQRTPKTPTDKRPVEATTQLEGTDDNSCHCNETATDVTEGKSKVLETEDETIDGKTALEAAYLATGDLKPLSIEPTFDKTLPSIASEVGALDESPQQKDGWIQETDLSPTMAKVPQIILTELSKNSVIQASQIQNLEEGSECTEVIAGPLVESSKINDGDQELEKANMEQASKLFQLTEPTIAEHEFSALAPEIVVKTDVESVEAKETDNRTTCSTSSSDPTEYSLNSTCRDNMAIPTKHHLSMFTTALDIPDQEREMEGSISSQPRPQLFIKIESSPQSTSDLISTNEQSPEAHKSMSTTLIPSAISTHKKRQNKRTPTGKYFPRKAKTVKSQSEQPLGENLASTSEPVEVGQPSHTDPMEGTDPGKTKLEIARQDSNSLLAGKTDGDLELTTNQTRNYPQVNEAHAVENLYVPPREASQLWVTLLPISQDSKSPQPRQVQVPVDQSTDDDRKIGEIDQYEKTSAALIASAQVEEGLPSTPQSALSDSEKKVQGVLEPVVEVVAGHLPDAKEAEKISSSPRLSTESQLSAPKKKKAKGTKKKNKKKNHDAPSADSGIMPTTTLKDKTSNLMNSPLELSTIDSDEMFPPLGSSQVKSGVDRSSMTAKNPKVSLKGKARAASNSPRIILLNADTLPEGQQPKDRVHESVAASIASYYQKKPAYTEKIMQELDIRSVEGWSDASITTSGRALTPVEPSTNASDTSDSGPPTQLSEASMKQHQANLTIDADVMQPPQHRRASSVAMSDFSTTSSRQRKLFSEVASSGDRTISPATKGSSSSGKGYVKENEAEKAIASVSINYCP